MMRLSVGDRVVIRYGNHQGKKATIITNSRPDTYKVKAEDGYILFFSDKGLQRETEEARGFVSDPMPGRPPLV